MRKICTKCKAEKDLEDFYKHKTGKFGRRPDCIKCRKEYMKQWQKSNKDHYNKYQKEYVNKRYKTDPRYRLQDCASRGLRTSLKTKKITKDKRHWESLVGYTIEELKRHLESLFTDGMSWDNYGKWHIDHIIPQSFFVFESPEDVEFRYCWSLNNLQPLWAADNFAKSDKVLLRGGQPSGIGDTQPTCTVTYRSI